LLNNAKGSQLSEPLPANMCCSSICVQIVKFVIFRKTTATTVVFLFQENIIYKSLYLQAFLFIRD
jgi:hypothetical protein